MFGNKIDEINYEAQMYIFDNEIEALGFSNLQHIYDELQYLADAFQMP